MATKIIERFPNYRHRVVDAMASDNVMVELCRDYDAVMSQLEQAEAHSSKENVRISKAYRELSRLKLELEHEVLTRLATIEGEDVDH